MFGYRAGLSMIPMRGHSLIEAQSFYELEAFVDNAHLSYRPSHLFPRDPLIGRSYASGLSLQAPQPSALAPAIVQMTAAPPVVLYETMDHLVRIVARSYGLPAASAGAVAPETAEEKDKREFEEWGRANGK
ncbi:predicted protein [Plenodomus lingam JN3]|uniref:Predicted protein n=1 Tax=Leptosphaeria maculans (strain JN3 / isolate v23.1.3 / race Av1-4-5-6-7-8) TaxID=985895 RepID=E5A946_LEPMJ|nr:predicted protein [Plenodomus lingam JN3]CBY00187.1 predicted protein [Plenodomus lingam JN3]